MEPYHIEIIQMFDFNQTIKIFADEDKKSTSEVKKNPSYIKTEAQNA